MGSTIPFQDPRALGPGVGVGPIFDQDDRMMCSSTYVEVIMETTPHKKNLLTHTGIKDQNDQRNEHS